MSVDARDGTWENPYFGFALTAPQGEVLYKRIIGTKLNADEKQVLTKIVTRLIEFNNPPDRREGRETLQAFGMLFSLPREEGQ
jgi:hypothetical protein